MIRPVNISIRNNNTQNNVNFKGTGGITDVVMRAVDRELIARLGHLPAKGTNCTNAVSEVMRIGDLSQYYPHVNFDVLNYQHSLLFRPHNGGAPSEEQIRRLLAENKLTNGEGVFEALPPQSLTVTDGTEQIADAFEGTSVTILGGHFNIPVKAQNFTVRGVTDSSLHVNANDRALITDSTIGNCEGFWVGMKNSNAQNISARGYADFAAKTTINGNVFAESDACFQNGSIVVQGNVLANGINVTPDGQVVIKQYAGTQQQPIAGAYIKGTLVTPKMTATKLDVSDNGHLQTWNLFADSATCHDRGKIDAVNYVAKSSRMPLRERLRRWLASPEDTKAQIRFSLNS